MEKHKLDNLSEIENRMRMRDAKKGKITEHDFELIYKFAQKATKEFGGFIHAIILFGSVAKDKAKKRNDIDLAVLVDDVAVPVRPETIGAYRVGIGQILAEIDAVEKLHLTTIGIADFWDGVRLSDPVIVNLIRDGQAITDTGFFSPMKKLLEMGRIRPSRESIEAHYSKAKALVNSVKTYQRISVDNLYWAVSNAAHAKLMDSGITPPTPREIPKLFKKYRIAGADFVDYMHKRMKRLVRERGDVDPIEVKQLLKKTGDFVERMEGIKKRKTGAKTKKSGKK